MWAGVGVNTNGVPRRADRAARANRRLDDGDPMLNVDFAEGVIEVRDVRDLRRFVF